MDFQTYVKTWSTNSFRQVINGAHVDRAQVPEMIRIYHKRNPGEIGVDDAAQIILEVAGDRGLLREPRQKK